MNILLDGGLPEEIGGDPLSPGFRHMMQVARAAAGGKRPGAGQGHARG